MKAFLRARQRNRRPVAVLIVVFLLTSVLTIVGLPGRAFAATASDDFNRADNASLGSNWTTISGDVAPAISSNAAVGTSCCTNTGAYWNANSFGNDQFSQIEVTASGISSGAWIAAATRVQANGDEYIGLYWDNGGTYELMLFNRIGGSWNEIDGGASVISALPAGTQLTLTASGSAITFAKNGVPVFSKTDTQLTGGNPGIEWDGTDPLDNWSGGDVNSVGGTASGLSGSVVLQDNSGDDLSVTANGSFTFATKLSPGAGYDVTVKVNPDQQVCTVSNATGTMPASNITSVSVTCVSTSINSATDDFNRASFGSNWTVAGLSLSSNQVSNAGGNAAADWTAQSFSGDQYSDVQITSSTLGSGDWIGPMVRSQNAFNDGYVCFYYNSGGSTYLVDMYKEVGGAWTQLGGYSSGQLSAGTTIKMVAIGSSLSCLVGGVEVITATDTSETGGAPGIWAFGASGTVDNWIGGETNPPLGSVVTLTAVIDPAFTFAVANQASACNGETNFVAGAGSATGVVLGNVAAGSNVSGGQALSVTGNSGGGFAVYVRGAQASQNLRSVATGHNWTDVAGTYASPAALGTGERFGYTYKDSTASSSVTNPGSGDFIALTGSTSDAVMGSSSSETGSSCVSYDAQASATTPAGSYSATVIYTAVPAF